MYIYIYTCLFTFRSQVPTGAFEWSDALYNIMLYYITVKRKRIKIRKKEKK